MKGTDMDTTTDELNYVNISDPEILKLARERFKIVRGKLNAAYAELQGLGLDIVAIDDDSGDLRFAHRPTPYQAWVKEILCFGSTLNPYREHSEEEKQALLESIMNAPPMSSPPPGHKRRRQCGEL
jgi:hypothetical protein